MIHQSRSNIFVTLIFPGLDGDQIVNSPEKLAVVEKFANEENIQKVMKEREERKKKKKKEEKTMKAFSPPPPPPPAPPVASRYYFSTFKKRSEIDIISKVRPQ